MKHPRPNVLAFVQRDRGYRFQDRDPDMEQLCGLISASGLTIGQIVEEVYKHTGGVYAPSSSTITNWLNGKTKRPSNFTMMWVGYALGLERRWVSFRTDIGA